MRKPIASLARSLSMGMEFQVHLPQQAPSLDAVKALLAEKGIRLDMRMINGQLAFPDEFPSAPWQEVRVAINKNMITLRNEGESLRVVAWGNADTAMQEAWHRLVWAIAVAGQGTVATEFGPQSPEAFEQQFLAPR